MVAVRVLDVFRTRSRKQDGGENGEVGCIAYHSTNSTNHTNRTNPTTKYRCEFVNLNCIFTNFTHCAKRIGLSDTSAGAVTAKTVYYKHIFRYHAFSPITCSTVVLQCYRRQSIPMEQAKIRPPVTLYSLDRSSPNLVRLITSATPTQTPVLVKFG